MDAAGTASSPTSLVPSAVLILFFSFAVLAGAQTSDGQLVDRVRQLSEGQHWQEIVALVGAAKNPSAELDFYYGTALAHLGH